MITIEQNNKRIAKNTLILYLRMLITMGVTLYMSRVVLNSLGVVDYGIYNVVGGVVAMFTMISGSLSAAISRFLTFELGKGNQKRLNLIFSTSVIIQIITCVIIAILAETIGIWFLTNKMVIPIDKLYAAKWVLHFSLITLIINMISVPYNATIIAHEKMSAFAYISILDAVGKLIVAYLISKSPIDNLIFYAMLMSSVALLVRLAYGIYCKKHFEECQKFRFVFKKDIFKEMFGFAGWNLVGVTSGVLRDQGGNILLNIFEGPAVNAARAISLQVRLAVMQFSSNFMTALNPQITKSYASDNKDYMMTLIFQGSRLSFYMLLILSLPILLSTDYILTLWLVDVPNHTVLFVQLALIFGMLESISNPLITAMLATGDIKKYQIVVGGLQLFNLPISYLFLKYGFFPQIIVAVGIFISLCCLFLRLYMLRSMIQLSIIQFLRRVVFNVGLVSVISIIIPYIMAIYFDNGLKSFILTSIFSLLSTSATIFFVGCDHNERQFVKEKIKYYSKKITKK